MPTLSFTINLNSTDTAVLTQIHAQLVANSRHLEKIMATQEELQSALDANTAATTAAGEAITAEIVQLEAAIAAMPVGEPVTQAQLDQLNASTAALEAATASLVADDAAPAA